MPIVGESSPKLEGCPVLPLKVRPTDAAQQLPRCAARVVGVSKEVDPIQLAESIRMRGVVEFHNHVFDSAHTEMRVVAEANGFLQRREQNPSRKRNRSLHADGDRDIETATSRGERVRPRVSLLFPVNGSLIKRWSHVNLNSSCGGHEAARSAESRCRGREVRAAALTALWAGCQPRSPARGRCRSPETGTSLYRGCI